MNAQNENNGFEYKQIGASKLKQADRYFKIGIAIVVLIVAYMFISTIIPKEAPVNQNANVQKSKYDLFVDMVRPQWQAYDQAKEQSIREWKEIEDMSIALSAKFKTLSELELKIKKSGSTGEQMDKYFKNTFELPTPEVLAQIETELNGKYTLDTEFATIKNRVLQLLDGKTVTEFKEAVPENVNENANAVFQ